MKTYLKYDTSDIYAGETCTEGSPKEIVILDEVLKDPLQMTAHHSVIFVGAPLDRIIVLDSPMALAGVSY